MCWCAGEAIRIEGCVGSEYGNGCDLVVQIDQCIFLSAVCSHKSVLNTVVLLGNWRVRRIQRMLWGPPQSLNLPYGSSGKLLGWLEVVGTDRPKIPWHLKLLYSSKNGYNSSVVQHMV